MYKTFFPKCKKCIIKTIANGKLLKLSLHLELISVSFYYYNVKLIKKVNYNTKEVPKRSQSTLVRTKTSDNELEVYLEYFLL